MKKKIISAILLICGILLQSCSTYSIKTDIENNSAVSKIKNTGIIFRVSRNSKIPGDEIIKNFSYWMSVHKKIKNILLLSNADDTITGFSNPQDRFYQLSNENSYLKYKSIGVINLYLQSNQEALKNIISKNNLDSLIILEVFTVISSELQFIEFESVLAVVDSDLNIIYLDHQSDNFESESSFINDLKNQLADMINRRLIDNLQGLNLIGDLTESRKNAANIAGEKTTAIPVKDTVQKPSEKAPDKSKEKPEIKPETSPATIKPAEIKSDKPSVIEKTAEQPKEKGDIKSEDKKPADTVIEKKMESSPEATPSNETKTEKTPSADKPASGKPAAEK
jgi:hypothetical protein